MIFRLILFLVLNFAGLALGGLFTSKGVPSEWYLGLNKAPWTPPGWAFGFAWTTIMICFSIYLAFLWPSVENKKFLISLFSIQWILNVTWNPVFFYYNNVIGGLLVIICLTVIIGFFLIYYWPILKLKSILILPYVLWLLIATSLNAYIFINN